LVYSWDENRARPNRPFDASGEASPKCAYPRRAQPRAVRQENRHEQVIHKTAGDHELRWPEKGSLRLDQTASGPQSPLRAYVPTCEHLLANISADGGVGFDLHEGRKA
jgi:hypothetical protein